MRTPNEALKEKMRGLSQDSEFMQEATKSESEQEFFRLLKGKLGESSFAEYEAQLERYRATITSKPLSDDDLAEVSGGCPPSYLPVQQLIFPW